MYCPKPKTCVSRAAYARIPKQKPPKKQKECEACGKPFLTSYSLQKYCSKKCARKIDYHRGVKKEFVCQNPHCGKTYSPKSADRNKYCSRECAFAAKGAGKVCASCGVEYKKGYSQTYCSAECSKRGVPLSCEWCGKPFHGKPSTKYCSNKCRWRWNPPEVEIQCDVCGRMFFNRKKNRRYCSDVCKEEILKQQKHTAKQNRRARLRNAFVAPVFRKEIYERDGWVCQICGEVVDGGLLPPHPMSPSIDHIVPLNKGGTHEPDNVQLAHFICNSIKGDSMVLAAT